MWMPNAFGMDAITALVAAGMGTERIEIGTAVVPTFPRHPVVMAQQALTAQAALGGRFTLGIGLSHKVMMEDAMGIPYERPAAHMREYLSVLVPLLRGEPVSFHGEQYNVETAVAVAEAATVPVVVAALGPAMLRLAGQFADGTITSWVGPKTLETHTIPGIRAAADEAGRPAPRILVGLPIELTSDEANARERVAERSAWYNTLPSYRSMLDIEGAEGPADIALVGDDASLRRQLGRLRDAGTTDLLAQIVTSEPGSPARTLAFLAEYAKES
jgi:F420-dependent oxidoreductase-like protein